MLSRTVRRPAAACTAGSGIMCHEKILFLDEPVSGLDPEVTADFYALIRHLNRREGITILMISHDLQATAADATHILHLGTPFFYGLASDYFHSEVHTHDRLI